MIKVLDPTAGPARGTGGVAPRPGTLDGKTIGVIWNGRAYGDRILSEALDLLKQRHRIREVVFRENRSWGTSRPRRSSRTCRRARISSSPASATEARARRAVCSTRSRWSGAACRRRPSA